MEKIKNKFFFIGKLILWGFFLFFVITFELAVLFGISNLKVNSFRFSFLEWGIILLILFFLRMEWKKAFPNNSNRIISRRETKKQRKIVLCWKLLIWPWIIFKNMSEDDGNTSSRLNCGFLAIGVTLLLAIFGTIFISAWVWLPPLIVCYLGMGLLLIF